LLDEEALTASSVVANRAMDRERRLTGVNSYARELGFDPLVWLRARLAAAADVAWLDLCCGRGRALLCAGEELRAEGLGQRIRLVGVDLVDAFDPAPAGSPVEFVTGSVATWLPVGRFDLVTCVHGLHYVGDKLGVIARAVAALTDDGLFAADFEPRPSGSPAAAPPAARSAPRCGPWAWSMTPAAGACAVSGTPRSPSRSFTSAPTTARVRTTPASPPCTRTTGESPRDRHPRRGGTRGGDGHPMRRVCRRAAVSRSVAEAGRAG
jgi:SAM-dependent methyltransferase